MKATREDYEAAARAANYSYKFYNDAFRIMNSPWGGREWNPLTDPADSFRLLCDAEINIAHLTFAVVKAYSGAKYTQGISESIRDAKGGRIEAAMQAIFWAAVETGRQLLEAEAAGKD